MHDIQSDTSPCSVIVDGNVQALFFELIHEAAQNQKIDANDTTLHYLVNLLSSFLHSRTFFDRGADGLLLKPLAEHYAEAVAAENWQTRNRCLRRLGDVALFISGVFADSLNRKPVDVDYYIAMGGNAYGYLSDNGRGGAGWQALSEVFEELSGRFGAFVDLLGEVSDRTGLQGDTSALRLYEMWRLTGSARTARRLRRLGIEPLQGSQSQRAH